MKKMIQPCGLHCIKVNHLGVAIGGQTILEDINLHIHCGSLNVIIGKNGAGKSTLIRAILDDIPHEGKIEFKDRENGKIQKLKIGYVPQTINIEKNTPVSVYDLIASYQCRIPVFLKKSRKMEAEIRKALEVFEAKDLIDKQVCNLSGGELQRALLAMAIMNEPNLLLLDEPVSGVDQNGMELFYRTMDYLKKNFDLSIILISHDLDYVVKYADKVILMDKTVLKEGSAKEVFASKEFHAVFGAEELPEYAKGGREKNRTPDF
ncbi:MAG: metal ABC transporter ATP-binding protein [Eubacterium sp.]|jgi:manganese-transporting ATPase|nr:metal ABC transporter ATP-binding protein [Eubacterium sp.]